MVLSIIIPVYKVENYIRECIDSIIIDSQYEYEIILVDDGSPDNSGAICDEYAEKYEIITVIHQENKGPSSARNNGIMAASGKYVCFLDSDDRLHKESLDKVLSILDKSNIELFFTKINKFDESSIWDMGDYIESEALRNKDKLEAMRYLASRPKFSGSACSKIFRRDFIIDNGIRFPEDGLHSEDLGFVLDSIYRAKSFDKLDYEWYEYRQNREGSRTDNVSGESLKGLLRFLNDGVEAYTIDREPKDDYSLFLMPFLAYEMLVLIYDYALLIGTKEQRREYRAQIRDKAWILNYGNILARLAKVSIGLVGIDFTAKLICIARKLKR